MRMELVLINFKVIFVICLKKLKRTVRNQGGHLKSVFRFEMDEYGIQTKIENVVSPYLSAMDSRNKRCYKEPCHH
jgi:hypothetical protein